MSEFLWVEIPFTRIPILAVVALVGIWFLLRNRATSIESKSVLDARIGKGQPVVMEFFSNM